MAESLLEYWLSRPQARQVARALKAAGYKRATYGFCYDKVGRLAASLEPIDQECRNKVAEIIMAAAGLKPVQDGSKEQEA